MKPEEAVGPGPRALLRAAPVLLVAYALVVTWLTWPMARVAATHLPDTFLGARFDPLMIGWGNARLARGLATSPTWPFDGGAYHPSTASVMYSDPGAASLLVFGPVYGLTGNPILASNALIFGGIIGAAAALHLLVYAWTGSHAAGAVAAGVWLGTRWVLWTWCAVAPNYALLWWVPWIIGVAARPVATRGAVLVLAGLLVAQGATSPYVAAAVLAPVGMVGLARAVRPSRRTEGVAVLGAWALACAALLVIYAPYQLVRSANPTLRGQSVWAGVARLPQELPSAWFDLDAPTALPTAAFVLVAVGSALRLMSGTRLPDRSLWWQGWAWVLIGVVVSLTPTVRWFGAEIVLPHRLLDAYTPLYHLIRFPSRLALAALFGGAVLAGLSFALVTSRHGRVARAVAAIAVLAVVYAEYAGGVRLGIPSRRPLPRSYPVWRPDLPAEPVAEVLSQPGGPLLELPVYRTHSPADAPLQARVMFRSLFHARRILNGYSSYYPEGFAERMQLARALPAPDALARLAADTGLELVLVKLSLFGAVERSGCALMRDQRRSLPARCGEDFGAEERRRWTEAAAAGRDDLQLVARAGDELLFRVSARGHP